MSEYQYYEFQAIDRPLSDKEMKEVRAYSTRAEITRRSFTNEYSYGDFKGNIDDWMVKYFDAFIYYANWGTHIFKLSLPADLLDFKTVESYCQGPSENLEIFKKHDKIVLSFSSENEDDAGWVEAGEWSLSSLASIRADLIQGDFRALYIGWLRSVQVEEEDEEHEDYDEEELEPPVPPGLAELNEGLTSLVEFLGVDEDWLNAAAARSVSLKDTMLSQETVHQWLVNLDSVKKDEWLARILIESREGHQKFLAELLQSFLKTQNKMTDLQVEKKRRSVGELRVETKRIAKKRVEREVEKKAQEKERKEKERRLAREIHLNTLKGREAIVWQQIEDLINKGIATSYKKAIEFLIDLSDLAKQGNDSKFQTKLSDLRNRHERRRSFIQSLNVAGLK